MTPVDDVFVAIDVGTSGARAVAITLAGRVVAQERRSYPISRPRPGFVEQDAAQWVKASEEALARLLQRLAGTAVSAIGLTGQCPSVVAVDGFMRPVAPGMLYLDNRAVAEAEQLRERFGDEKVHERTGHVPAAFYVGPKILWMSRRQPELFAATRHFLQPRDLVLHHLTGELLTDATHAGATLLFDIRDKSWSNELTDAVGLGAAQLPEVVPSSAEVGGLRKELRRSLGLRGDPPVVIGGADSLCAAYGVGAFEAGPVSEMAGSSSCFNSAVSSPVRSLKVANYVSVVPEMYMTEIGLNVAGAAIRWAVTSLGFGSFSRLETAAGDFRRRLGRRRPLPDPVELAPIFLPYLGDGDRDDPRLRGALLGLSGRHDVSAVAYAMLEGVALAAKSVLGALRKAGQPFDELRVSGGAARLALSAQLKADVLGVPVLQLAADSTAVGTGLLAAEATGNGATARASIKSLLSRGNACEPDPRLSPMEQERAARFEELRLEEAVRAPR